MKTISRVVATVLIVLSFSITSFAQESKVEITGVRFAYPLVNAWIEAYKTSEPDANIQIESRTSTDPAKYDLLIEAYEPDSLQKETRDFIYIGRYALLPVANSKSAFVKEYGDRGVTEDVIRQAYFANPYGEKEHGKKIEVDYTVYTRLQKAGAPITLAKYFGFDQSNIKGKAIAGADEHLIKAVLKDSTAISYATLGLAYDLKTRRPVSGLTILPVDLDDNGRVNNEEKIYGNIDQVISRFEAGNLENVPVEYLHVSISKKHSNPEALKFLQWILNNGQDQLNQFGFLKPEPKRFQREREKLLKQLTLN